MIVGAGMGGLAAGIYGRLDGHQTTMGGRSHESIELQLYGFDPTMVPPGKGVIRVELPASYAYWRDLCEGDRDGHRHEKDQVAEGAMAIRESHFPGLREQVEVVGVCTPMTWERNMGGSQGWFNLPDREFSLSLREDIRDKKFTSTLSGFCFVGVWVTIAVSLFHNADAGRRIVRRTCAGDGKKCCTTAEAGP